jgi:hypothetical protein
LLTDPDCRYDFKGGWRQLTADEHGNWEARELLIQLIHTFPVPTDFGG